MPRRIRIQYPGALYHVLNRGNYRRDVFETEGAAKSFESTLGDTCRGHGWIVHAFAIMRNQFHLALETPEPNLVDGMHWLQSAYSTRFNRYRSENGHVFQGRYQSLLIEDDTALLRVVDYLPLNPVRAGIVPAERILQFPSSSLPRFVIGPRPPWLSAGRTLAELALDDSGPGWASYLDHLRSLAGDKERQEELGFARLSRGWAIGTDGWRRALACEYAHLALTPDLSRTEITELKEARWRGVLREVLMRHSKSADDILHDEKGASWKIAAARQLRREAGAPYRWIAQALNSITPAALRA